MRFIFVFIAALVPFSAIAQTCNDAIARTSYEARYQVTGDEARDLLTDLVWQRCSYGLVYDDGGTAADLSDDACNDPPENTDDSTDTLVQVSFTWNDALETADAESAGGWRLPNLKELSTLIEYACFSPAIDPAVFPNSAASEYWSSTPSTNEAFEAWAISFSDGADVSTSKSNFFPVRLVRDF